MTQSIQKFLAVSEYRRRKQVDYNREHNITPRSVSRAVEESLSSFKQTHDRAHAVLNEAGVDIDINETIQELEQEMLTAANNLEFEKAALLRDQVRELKRTIEGATPVSYARPDGGKKGMRSAARGKRAGGKVEEPF
jgi:excinuclease ABC subunit B